MKYIVVLGDGMADEPIAEIGGKTPLAHANTPMMDELAGKSVVGLSATIPEGMSPGSDTANLEGHGHCPSLQYRYGIRGGCTVCRENHYRSQLQ